MSEGEDKALRWSTATGRMVDADQRGLALIRVEIRSQQGTEQGVTPRRSLCEEQRL